MLSISLRKKSLFLFGKLVNKINMDEIYKITEKHNVSKIVNVTFYFILKTPLTLICFDYYNKNTCFFSSIQYVYTLQRV